MPHFIAFTRRKHLLAVLLGLLLSFSLATLGAFAIGGTSMLPTIGLLFPASASRTHLLPGGTKSGPFSVIPPKTVTPALTTESGGQLTPTSSVPQTPPQIPPTATPSLPSPTPLTTATIHVLAQDTFARPDQPLWGIATDRHVWSADANASPAFSIEGGQGIIEGTGIFTALLGPRVTTSAVLATGSLDLYFPKHANLGVVARWQDANDWYKAYLDGSQLVILKSVQGVQTMLASAPFPALNTFAYSIRFETIGSLLKARAWSTGAPEPTTWLVSVHDNTLSTGRVGIRVLLNDGNMACFRAFFAQTA